MWQVRKYTSFLVVRSRSTSLRFIIFNRNKINNQTHVNITGVDSRPGISHSIEKLCALLNVDNTLIQWKIDNISAISKHLVDIIGQNYLDLNEVKNHLSASFGSDYILKFNPEVFSALVIKSIDNTALLFSSGKIFVIRSKSEENIRTIIDQVSKIACSVHTMTKYLMEEEVK